MHEKILLNAIIQTVPQWYLGSSGRHVHSFLVNDVRVEFCSHHRISGHLLSLLEFVERNLTKWVGQQPRIPTPGTIAGVKEEIALEWLNLHDSTVDWNKWIAYAEGVRQRTYENRNNRMNLIISDGEGCADIGDIHLQKVFDPLASHTHVYMRVDKDFRFMDYDEIQWEEVKDVKDHKFSPEFLQPYLSILRHGEFFAHLTSKGELVIADARGILASCRKGQWHLYSHEALRDCIAEIIGDTRVGRNLIEILFDLSYGRQGALLVFDPDSQVINQVVNPHSIIRDGKLNLSDLPRRLLADRIKGIQMGSSVYRERKKRLFIEIAGIDGALIFDTKEVLAFGAMIRSHPQVGSYFGARMTAAQSALLWGGHSFVVSSDGEIVILFKQKDDGVQSELRFM